MPITQMFRTAAVLDAGAWRPSCPWSEIPQAQTATASNRAREMVNLRFAPGVNVQLRVNVLHVHANGFESQR
jgi:hypothetical protein